MELSATPPEGRDALLARYSETYGLQLRLFAADGASPLSDRTGTIAREAGRPMDTHPDDLSDLDDWVIEYLVELKHDPELLRGLWERSDLPFPDPPPAKEQALPANQ